MIEKCAVWRDLGEEEKLLSFSLSPSVYMEINFNSILGTELIPSSHYRVDTDAIFFSHTLSGLKYLPMKDKYD